MIACTGWTWEYISEHMDLPRLDAMKRYWKQHPPLHLLFATFAGYQGESAPVADEAEEAQRQQFINTVPAADFDDILKQHGLPTP